MSPPRKKDNKEEVARPPPDSLHSGDILMTGSASPKYIFESRIINVGNTKWQASIDYHQPVTVRGRLEKKSLLDSCLPTPYLSSYTSSPYLVATLQSRMFNRSPLWSISVKASFVLINSDSSKNIVINERLTFNSRSELHMVNLIGWYGMIRGQKGFVKDNKVTIVINLSIVTKIGFRTFGPPYIDFTIPNDQYHDITLMLEGEKVYASKAILSINSPVFNAMFYGNFDEKDKKEIVLKEIDREDFIEVLKLIYHSCQDITVTNAEPILIIADQFQIQPVIDQVEDFLITETSTDVALKVKLSHDYRLLKLQDSCREYFNEMIYMNREVGGAQRNHPEMPLQIDFTDANEPLHDVALYLALLSPFFKEKFDGCNEDKNEYERCGIDREEFLEMLRVIYPTGQKITDNNAVFLLKLAHRYNIDYLHNLVENHLISSSNLALPAKLLLSERHKLLGLQGDCINKWQKTGKKMRETAKDSDEFDELSKEFKKALRVS